MGGQHNETAADMLNMILALEFKMAAAETGSSRLLKSEVVGYLNKRSNTQLGLLTICNQLLNKL